MDTKEREKEGRRETLGVPSVREIRRRHRRRVNVWLVVGVIVLVLLLLLWLTWADLLGDTDVGNFIEVVH